MEDLSHKRITEGQVEPYYFQPLHDDFVQRLPVSSTLPQVNNQDVDDDDDFDMNDRI